MKEIIIHYKRIKNIYIRVKPDLNIHVNAPKRVTKKYIKEIIEKRKDWIEERIEAMQKRNISDFTLKELEDGNEIFYLGKSYMLKVVKSRRENIILAGRIMYMYVNISNNLNNKRKKQLTLDIWYKKEAIKLFEELIKKYSSLMNLNTNITFTVKKLKSKWGQFTFCIALITHNVTDIGQSDQHTRTIFITKSTLHIELLECILINLA